MATVRLRRGLTKTLLTVKAGGPNLNVPGPATATQLLNQNPVVTVQLIKSDGNGECWEAVYASPARRHSSSRFVDALP